MNDTGRNRRTGAFATRAIPAEPLAAAVEAAAEVIARGGLAALPTETVYGLSADAAREDAVAALFRAKGRPSTNPLIVHACDARSAEALGEWTDAAARLADAFWPGPLTLVVTVKPGTIAPAALAGGDTVALRVPDAPVLRAVAQTRGPLVAPSANRSGRVSATSADAVRDELSGLIDLIIDGGPSAIGVESTVIDVTHAPRLLRPGAVTVEALARVLGAPPAGPTAPAPGTVLRSPGLLTSHYAPNAALRLDVDANDVREDEAWLAFGPAPSPVPAERTFALSPSGDLTEAARRLYHGLRTLDATGVATIAVAPIPRHGVGAAICDRLARAAAPRGAPPHEAGAQAVRPQSARAAPAPAPQETS